MAATYRRLAGLDSTSLRTGRSLSQPSTITEALAVEGTYRFELVDANDKVRWSSVGDNREDAHLSRAIRPSAGPFD
jgi:phage-related baseplate assembly protein